MSQEKTIQLFDVGALVNLRIGTWSGRRMVTEADFKAMGIDTKSIPKNAVNYGRKLLISKEELQVMTKIEQRARSFLNKWSIPFFAVGAHFVPINQLPNLEAHLQGLKDEFFGAVDNFIKRFEELKEKMKESCPEFWTKCLKQYYPLNPKSLREKFKFEWFIFEIDGGTSFENANLDKLIGKDKAKQERIKSQREVMQKEAQKFAEEYVSTMRKEVVDFCELMSARVNGKPYGDEDKPKKLTPRSLSMFRKYVDKFANMNIFGDDETEKMLKEFKDQFFDDHTTPKDFENTNIQKSLTSTLNSIKNKAEMEGENYSKFINSLKRRVVI